jgi:hypothetical protein
MQPVIAYFLVKLPTGKFAALMVLCWGVVLSCMAVAKNFKGLLATRFFLGCFEASVGLYFYCLIKINLSHDKQLQLSLPLLKCGGGVANRQTETLRGMP